MDQSTVFYVVKEIDELRNKLSLSKRIGFFFGAGSSMAIGIPGITDLTNQVKEKLDPKFHNKLKRIEDDLSTDEEQIKTIEDILNHIRLIREITREDANKNYCDINGVDAKNLDTAICLKIYEILSNKEDEIASKENNELKITEKFFAWLNLRRIDYAKEIFTTNYDLVFEKALENLQLPYFDGFVGANRPFFLPESLESRDIKETPPLNWYRLWKMHGSLGWFWERNNTGNANKVIRLGVHDRNRETSESEPKELVIYPSKEKYESSRKQPYVAYFDRFKCFLSEGEGILIISGYSFGDEHINEVIFNGLRQNNKLHIMAFLYKDEEIERIKDNATLYLNMSVFSPRKAIIGGDLRNWSLVTNSKDINTASFWDIEGKIFTLGDFKNLVNFLVDSSGKKQIIDEKVEYKK